MQCLIFNLFIMLEKFEQYQIQNSQLILGGGKIKKHEPEAD